MPLVIVLGAYGSALWGYCFVLRLELLFVMVMIRIIVEYVPSNCFVQRLRSAVSVLVGPCCPALLNCIDVDVHSAYCCIIGQIK